MNVDRHSIVEASLPISDGATSVCGGSYLEAVGRMARASVIRKVWADLWVELDRFLWSSVQNVESVQAYSEDAFQYLLTNECRRSERSGHSFKVLLAYLTTPDGSTAHMDDNVARKLLAGLSRSLRETDYVGWYRDGVIVGGVLTALGHDPMAEVSVQVEQRFVQVLQEMFTRQEISRLQFRVCHYHELERVESRDEDFAIS